VPVRPACAGASSCTTTGRRASAHHRVRAPGIGRVRQPSGSGVRGHTIPHPLTPRRPIGDHGGEILAELARPAPTSDRVAPSKVVRIPPGQVSRWRAAHLSYLPNPRIWKGDHCARLCGVLRRVPARQAVELRDCMGLRCPPGRGRGGRTTLQQHRRSVVQGRQLLIRTTLSFRPLRAAPSRCVQARRQARHIPSPTASCACGTRARSVSRSTAASLEALTIDRFWNASLVFAEDTQPYLWLFANKLRGRAATAPTRAFVSI